MKLSTFIHQFFEKYLPQIKGVSPNSIKAYRDTFKLFLPFAASHYGIKVGSLSLNHFTPEVILTFLDHLESERKNTAKTRNHRLAAIKSLAKMIRFMLFKMLMAKACLKLCGTGDPKVMLPMIRPGCVRSIFLTV